MRDILVEKYTSNIGNDMFEVKKEELIQLSKVFDISYQELNSILDDELKKSMFKVGTCNTAIDFLIVKVKKEGNTGPVRNIIKECIMYASMYYANVADKSEYV